uniref:Putative ovule protein n=1 Tax=Solanum chacoense TaxID=4108 RepID=A0A0V0GPV5_SOLCH
MMLCTIKINYWLSTKIQICFFSHSIEFFMLRDNIHHVHCMGVPKAKDYIKPLKVKPAEKLVEEVHCP